MAEPAKPPPKQTVKSAPKPSGGGNDFDLELVILVFMIGFLLLGVSGSVLDSFSVFTQNIYIYRFILALKIVSGTVATLSLIGIVYVFSESIKFRHAHLIGAHAHTASPEPRPEAAMFALEWSSIYSRLETATDADAALIIIDADALADRILKELGLPGETMGERLKALGEQKFKEIDALWDAHKIRNQIAHEGARNITYSDAAYALAKYEKALKELGVI